LACYLLLCPVIAGSVKSVSSWTLSFITLGVPPLCSMSPGCVSGSLGLFGLKVTCWEQMKIQIISDMSLAPLYLYLVAWEVWGIHIKSNNMRMNLGTIKWKRRLREYESVTKLLYMLRTINLAEMCHNRLNHIIELTIVCSSLDGIWTHTIDTLQHQSQALCSAPYTTRPHPLYKSI
jgi:hypothetical protein